MRETDDDWGVTKAIVSIVHDALERVVASLSIKEKKEFVNLTSAKVVALMPIKTLAQPRFVIVTTSAQGMTRSSSCYTPEEFSHGGQKNNQGKRSISEGEAE